MTTPSLSAHEKPGSTVVSSLVAAALVCLAVGLLLTGAIAAPASAGDTVALFSFDPEELEADPGDTVTVDVVLQAQSGYDNEGVDEVSFGVEYDPDVLTVTEIERTQWLEGETAEAESDETTVDVTTDIDDEAGLATISQVREPAGNGTTGRAPVATVTLEVSEDAQPTDAELVIVDSNVGLVSDYPQGTMVRDGTVVVDGGDSDADGEDDDDDPEGITLADDGDGDEDEENSASESTVGDDETDADEAIPGFGALIAIGTLAAAAAVAVRRGA